MTIAVCYMCGELKFGAFNSCGKCGGSPKTEDDFALSLAMTDHYFDKPTLEKMGADLKMESRPTLIPRLENNSSVSCGIFPGCSASLTASLRSPGGSSGRL
jgi:hypothetical protein